MAELSPDFSLSHYRIVSKIGAGGMGEVYLAQDSSELGRTVALKILPAEIARDKDRLQRFTQEARTVSNLNHPNILTVHEFGQTDSATFIAMEIGSKSFLVSVWCLLLESTRETKENQGDFRETS